MLRLRWGLAQSFDRCSARIDRCPPARAAWPARGAADERHQRLAFAAACARHSDAVVDFWFRTMMNTKAEMTHRIACSLHLMNRAHGMPVQVTHESVTENRKQILEVRWMPPDPNDRSRLIEPEPD
jgi:hypothetical protein